MMFVVAPLNQLPDLAPFWTLLFFFWKEGKNFALYIDREGEYIVTKELGVRVIPDQVKKEDYSLNR